MSAITNIGLNSQDYPSLASKTPAASSSTTTGGSTSVDQPDTVELSHSLVSETGRIALNAKAGNLSSDQATELYQQVSSIQSQIAADKQANGGKLSQQDAQTIHEAVSQLSSTIYSDAHNGAAPPPNSAPTEAGRREGTQAGRIVLNVQAGRITSDQAQQLEAQQAKIDQLIATDKQAGGGALSAEQQQQINQMQNQASKLIYQASHPSGS